MDQIVYLLYLSLSRPPSDLLNLTLLVDDGFRLTYLGYDFLAIKTMVNKGVFVGVGRQIGVGKESGTLFSFMALML